MEFIPKDEWKSTYFSLEDLKRTYFAKRNGPARHFNYKLANALKITREFSNSYNYIGVVQIERCLIKVNSMIFGSLLGIHAVQGGLFHKQGNFLRNGFQQVPKQMLNKSALEINVDDADDNEVRIFRIPAKLSYLPLT